MTYNQLAYEGYQRVLRVRHREQVSMKAEIFLPYQAHEPIEQLLDWMRYSFGQVYYDLEYDWLLATASGQIVHCQQCYQVPGVDEATAYECRDDGVRDGRYWAEYVPVQRLLCSKCQRRQKALRRLIRMRGWTVLGEVAV